MLEFIYRQKLERGAPLPSEHEFARRAGVSRSIVREALSRLKADGLIDGRRGARTVVRQQPGERAIHHLRPAAERDRLDQLEARIALEPAMARVAAQVCDAEAVKLLGSVALRTDGGQGGDEAAAFHRAVAAATRNPMFLVALDALAARAGKLLAVQPADGTASHIAAEHLDVVEAIVRGDAETAEAAMRLHLLKARDRALRSRRRE